MPSHQEEWAEVAKGVKIRNKPSICEHKQNRYDILSDGEEEIDDDHHQKHQHLQVKSFEAEDVEKLVPTYDAEEMSCEEISNIIKQYNDKNTTTTKECPQCEDTTEAYDSLVCEYKRVEQYMIDQITQIEDIRNEKHCITLMNYLEMNERKAQMN